jgi:predicted cupin superfamily sugar epimerase
MPNYIDLLNLEKHIEGGYFSVFYKSKLNVLPLTNTEISPNENIVRSAGTSIYFLLEKENFSTWHRLKSDEIWHYYDGNSPIEIHTIDLDGNLKTHVLGHPGITDDASFQVVITAGCWFSAELSDKTSFALAGCTVNPGFEYQDFEIAIREKLISEHPQHEEIITRYTHA